MQKNNLFRTIIIAVMCMALLAGMVISSTATEGFVAPEITDARINFQVIDTTADESGNASIDIKVTFNDTLYRLDSVLLNITHPDGITMTHPATNFAFEMNPPTSTTRSDVFAPLSNPVSNGNNTATYTFTYGVSGVVNPSEITVTGDPGLLLTELANTANEVTPAYIPASGTISVPSAPQTKPTITNAATLPPAVVGEPYTGKLEPAGTYTPKTSPNGLSLDAQGNITGTPTTAGDIVFEGVIVTVDGTPSDPVNITVPVNTAIDPAKLLGDNPNITKVIDGTGANSTEFNFTLEAISAAPMPDTTSFSIATADQGINSNLDFKTASYPEPGKYYYKLSETNGSAPNFDYDDTVYYIEVTVAHNAVAGTNEVRAVVAATEMNGAQDALQGEKVTGLVFTNTYNNPVSTTANLSLKKNVTGEMASTQKYFDFTVTLTDASNAPLGTVNYTGAKNGSLTNGTGTISLKHGEEITFRDLPKDTKYQIVEAPASGYTPSNTINGTAQQTADTASGTLDANTNVAYVNDARYAPPTGISMNGMLPFAGMAVICLGAAALLIAKKRGFAK